jgi:glycosyltransferase involved in cell wall biosynthesis
MAGSLRPVGRPNARTASQQPDGMRILYLHQYFNTPRMTGGTRSYEMARRLVARGHEVHVVTSSCDPPGDRGGRWFETEEAGVRVHWLPVPYSNTMSYGKRIKAFSRFAVGAAFHCRKLSADVVFATSTPLTIALPAVYAARKQRIPMVFEVRDLWPEVPIALGALRGALPIAAARALERFAYRSAAHVVALSPGMQEGVVATGVPAERVSVIPNGSDLELFDVGAEPGRLLRAQHSWLGDRPLVIYAGTLGLVNGVEYLVRLAAAVGAIDGDIRFLVVGTGREEQKVRSLARTLGVLDRNFFMRPQVAKEEVPRWLSAADMATSVVIDVQELWANSANKFFDSLAAGKPIAINHEGWQADILRDTGAGLVLSPHDLDRAAEDLVRGLRDREWLVRAGAAARRQAVERFHRDRLAAELEQVLLRAVAA